MHTVVFHMKRAFQSTLRVTRPLFESLGITPARFDMLSAVGDDQVPQADLRRQLGVSATTVSRMLQALEALGLISRRIPDHDTRTRIVRLTERGLLLLRRASRLIVWSGTVERLLLDVLAPRRARHIERRRLEAFDAMEGALYDLSWAFGDTATAPYPDWHPDS